MSGNAVAFRCAGMHSLRRSPWDVSVVIPAYNRANLLPSTLDAILAQTHRPAEIIVVDDGSTDATPEVMRRCKAPVVYHRIENGGVCRARNTGVRLSTSPWVAFCDSDDLWLPDKLASQVQLLQRLPDLSYVFCDFRLLTEYGIDERSKFARVPDGYWDQDRCKLSNDHWVFDRPLYRRLLRYQPIFPSTVLMHRAFFDRAGGFDEQWAWTPAEDVEFALRCMQHAPVGVVARPLVHIRKHTSNFSGQRLNSALGLVEIYRHAKLRHQPCGQMCASALDEQIAIETWNAIEGAFASGRLDIVRRLMPTVRTDTVAAKVRLKLAIARLPHVLAEPVRRALTFASTAWERPAAA